MTDAPIRRRVVVRGRVQGVFFRGATQEVAERAGVAGWVRNRGDGSVEAIFEGAPAAVEAVLAFVAEGPPAARVEALETSEEALAGEVGFRILR